MMNFQWIFYNKVGLPFIFLSEFHFLPPSYVFVALITPSNVRSSKLPILQPLKSPRDTCLLVKVRGYD